ncbi:MAG: biotin/lipoyl-containing protein, partial [Chloroflexota bacterium]
MPKEIFMPQLGLTMTEGIIVKWLKKVGEPVAKGEPIFEVETDKVTQEVPSLEEGTLAQLLVGDGGVVPVGKTVAYLVAPGESLAQVGGNGDGETGRDGDRETGRRGDEERSRPSVLNPQSSALAPEGWVRASPAAKKLAQKLGLDYRSLPGSGPGGRVVEADVRRAAEGKVVAATAGPVAAPAPAAAHVPPSPAAT